MSRVKIALRIAQDRDNRGEKLRREEGVGDSTKKSCIWVGAKVQKCWRARTKNAVMKGCASRSVGTSHVSRSPPQAGENRL